MQDRGRTGHDERLYEEDADRVIRETSLRRRWSHLGLKARGVRQARSRGKAETWGEPSRGIHGAAGE